MIGSPCSFWASMPDLKSKKIDSNQIVTFFVIFIVRAGSLTLENALLNGP